MDVKYLVSQMTLEEKASLLSGGDFWHTKAVQRLGIRPVMVSDGPHGLRKQRQEADHLGVNESIKAVCFPTACATAASFDPALTREMGEALGDACQHESVAVLLGPGVNIKRSPLCGRNFEYFSEDPFLAGEMAASLIEGVQSRGIGTSLKHYLANNQEHRRMSSSSDMDPRTLREIYMPAFEKAVKRGKPWTVMCSYNRVNGEYVNESRFLLTDVLRGEWGFDGYVMSDWGAVSDRVRGVHAGMDLEMPASGGVNDRRVVEAYLGGQAVGGATRDILWGDVNPCGRLPETFPLRLEDTPCFLTYGGEGDHAPYSEGLFVGYRYYDKKRMEVLFPFGYGLSYTRFAYANLRLSAASIRDTDALEVSVEVTNTGNRKGKEVVQLYVADRESSALRPLRELKGMAKVELAPGETREVRFTLDHRAFAYWSEELGDWYVESGAFGIQIGRSSRDIALEAEVEVTGTKTLPAHFTMNSIFIDLMKNEKARMELKPLIDAVAQTLGGPREDGEAAQSAITNDMMQAMINYMPLRGLVSFGGGLSHEALEDILKRINDPDAPGACAR